MGGWKMLEVVLAAIMVVGFPLMDLVRMSRLKKNSTHAARMCLYRLVVFAEWGAVVLVLLLGWLQFRGARPFFQPGADLVAALPHLAESKPAVFLPVIIGVMIGLLIPVIAAWIHPAMRSRINSTLQPLAFLLPQGADERRMFVAVALTAGICEEVLYRGFLLHVCTVSAGMRAPVAISLSVIAFGVAHLYQGWKGALGATVLGALLMAGYLVTGSLLPGIVIHALIDLRPLLMLPREGSPFEQPGLSY